MKTIHAVYEDGVFRPTEPVNLASGTEVDCTVTQPPSASLSDQPTLIGLLQFCGTVNDLPADMAAQHDHYLHGTPKQ